MAGNISVKANRINVADPVFCLLTSDTADAVTYGEIESLGDAMQIQITPGVQTGVLYGNGVQKENITMLSSIALALDVNKVKIEARAKILGNKYENGVLIETAGDEAPYIALGFRVDQTNGKAEYVWLLKGRAQPINDNVQQKTETINFSTNTLNINFIPREKDKQLRYFADSANADFTEDQAKAWFANGPTTPVSAAVTTS